MHSSFVIFHLFQSITVSNQLKLLITCNLISWVASVFVFYEGDTAVGQGADKSLQALKDCTITWKQFSYSYENMQNSELIRINNSSCFQKLQNSVFSHTPCVLQYEQSKAFIKNNHKNLSKIYKPQTTKYSKCQVTFHEIQKRSIIFKARQIQRK